MYKNNQSSLYYIAFILSFLTFKEVFLFYVMAMQYGKREQVINVFLEKNNQLNLSAIRDEEGIYTKHIQDSLGISKILQFESGSTVCDIGTGGGFPLLPLAIEYPEVQFTGIDARKKKVDAVNDMISQLNLSNVQAIWSRMEEYHQQFDYITARAVGYVDKLIPRSYHLLKPGGKFLLWKKVDQQERTDLLKICDKKNLDPLEEYEYTLFPDDIQRVIYVIEKL